MKKKKTLQQIADEEGVTRQAIWIRTEKGRAYRKSDKYKAYRRAYRKAYYHKLHPNAKYYKLKNENVD